MWYVTNAIAELLNRHFNHSMGLHQTNALHIIFPARIDEHANRQSSKPGAK